MAEGPRLARDLDLLDKIDAFAREAFEVTTWRVVRSGRDPTLGSPSQSRWCDGTFEVLYTALDHDGAVAEIHALLSLQPVFPSKDQWFVSTLGVSSSQTLKLADLATLERLGVDTARYETRDYRRTRAIADAAYFLGFDGLVAPSARWPCLNLVLFTDHLPPDGIEIRETSRQPIDWTDWRARYGR